MTFHLEFQLLDGVEGRQLGEQGAQLRPPLGNYQGTARQRLVDPRIQRYCRDARGIVMMPRSEYVDDDARPAIQLGGILRRNVGRKAQPLHRRVVPWTANY